MSYWRALRWSSAWIFLPLVTIAAYAGSVSEREFFGDYPLVGTSQAWVSLVVIVPLLAGWGAWDAARLRPWLDTTLGGAHRVKALLRALGLPVALAIVCVVVVVLLIAGRPVALASWAVMAAAVVTMVAAAVLGIALGMVTSKLTAAPIAVLALYGAMALPVADPSRWLACAIITGTVAPCCASTQQINLTSLGAVLATSALVALSALVVLSLPLGRLARGAALGLALGTCVLIAWMLTRGTAPEGQIVARTTAPVCQGAGGARICVWPEHSKDLPRIQDSILSAVQTAHTLGLDLPTAWSEKPTPGIVTFMWAPVASENQHRYSLGLDIAHWAGCTSPEEEALVASSLALKMGVPASELSDRDPTTDLTARFTGLSEPAQRQWIVQHVRQCQA
jgi:hypothetical protein